MNDKPHQEEEKSKKSSKRTSAEEYMRMDEQAKDLAIQKAVLRLQNRIHEILYMMGTEMNGKIASSRDDNDDKVNPGLGDE